MRVDSESIYPNFLTSMGYGVFTYIKVSIADAGLNLTLAVSLHQKVAAEQEPHISTWKRLQLCCQVLFFQGPHCPLLIGYWPVRQKGGEEPIDKPQTVEPHEGS